MTAGNFWDANIWSTLLLFGLLLGSMLLAHWLKQCIKPLKRTLIPASVLAGILLLTVSLICKAADGTYLFDYPVFTAGSDFSGIGTLEMLTYHCLAIGFISMALRRSGSGEHKGRGAVVLNSGLLTVCTYLIQGVLGLAVTVIAARAIPGMIEASGVLLAFGFGQGTGQALNYGALYETQYGFIGGKSFGLTVAALGFLGASIGGVIYLNVLRKKGLLTVKDSGERRLLRQMDIEHENELPMTESIDKLTVQLALVALIYLASYGVMAALGALVGDGLKATIFGFNFLMGTLMAVLFKAIFRALRKAGLVKREYVNDFLMNRISGMAFDLMIVAGIGAIRLDAIKQYWGVLAVMAIVGLVSTMIYVRFVCKRLFPDYEHEQFMAFFGMLTGTASTGAILLREIDPEFKTPVSDNLVYQTLPAIVFGFPLMFLASYAPQGRGPALLTIGICLAMLAAFNLILFRKQLFGKKKGK